MEEGVLTAEESLFIPNEGPNEFDGNLRLPSPPSAFCSHFFAVFSAVDVTDAALHCLSLSLDTHFCVPKTYGAFSVRVRMSVRRKMALVS